MLGLVPVSGRVENSPMLRPVPLPDELISGVITRIARVKGVGRQALEQELISVAKLKNYKVPPVLGGLAIVLRMDVGDLTAQHSLVPFWKAFAREKVPFREQTILLANTSPPKREVRFCKACVEDDLKEYGFSYWRRTHQVPGVVICPSHGEVLYVARKVGDSNKLPEDLVDHCEPAISKLAESELQRLQVYCVLANHLVHRTEPFDFEVLRAAVRKRVDDIGLRTWSVHEKRSGRQSIADLANELVPGDWLRRYFASGKSGPTNSYSFGLTQICSKQGCSTAASTYVLALTLLFRSAEAAISALSDANPVVGEPSRGLRSHEKDGNEDLFNALVRHHGEIYGTANDLGLRQGTLRERLFRFGLISLEPILGTPIELALADFFEGGSLRKVCRRHGVSEAELESMLRRTSALFSHLLKRVRKKRTQTQREQMPNAA